MKKDEIKVGGHYLAKVSGSITTVRVDGIRETTTTKTMTVYDVTNLATGRRTTFRSAAKFRSPANLEKKLGSEHRQSPPNCGSGSDTSSEEGEQSIPFAAASPFEIATSELSSSSTSEVAREEGEQCADPTKDHASTAASQPIPLQTQKPTAASNILADRIASTRLSEIPDTVAGYIPTDEQKAILEAALEIAQGDGPRVLVIEAGAGAGKTSTLKMIEEVLPGRGQYTAFNKPLVEESKTKFRKAKCNTTHSLAFQPCGRDYQHRLGGQRVRSQEVADMLGLEFLDVDTGVRDEKDQPVVKRLQAWLLASHVRLALQKFSQSVDYEIGEHHFHYIAGIDQLAEDGKRGWDNNLMVRRHLLSYARRAWEDIASKDGKLPFTHDYYVKLWQLAAPVIPADYILLDEDQDTAPVFADIIQRQKQAILVLVGDENQAIYEWRGAVNATRLFPDASVRYLTQSFRFGQAVADVANSILAEMDEPSKLRMRGVDVPSRVLLDAGDSNGGDTDRSSEYLGTVCYLYRTNAGAVGKILREHAAGRRGCLIGKIDNVLSFVEGALDLQRGRRTSNPELAVFEGWQEVQKYVKEDPDGADMQLMVKLVDDFGCERILSALNGMPKEQYADFVCSTAHKSKGREWDTVVLRADFPPRIDMSDADRRLLYVAATRAKLVLDLTSCTPFREYTDRDGRVTPGIRVEFTRGDPTREELDDYLAGKSDPRTAPESRAVKETSTIVTYSKLRSGEWGLRSTTEIKEGQVVTVTTKAGERRTETIGKIVWSGQGVWLATNGSSGKSNSSREVCAECGKPGYLVADLEDGWMKHRRCCDMSP